MTGDHTALSLIYTYFVVILLVLGVSKVFIFSSTALSIKSFSYTLHRAMHGNSNYIIATYEVKSTTSQVYRS